MGICSTRPPISKDATKTGGKRLKGTYLTPERVDVPQARLPNGQVGRVFEPPGGGSRSPATRCSTIAAYAASMSMMKDRRGERAVVVGIFLI